MSQLIHINSVDEAHMVDVAAKAETICEVRAEEFITMNAKTLNMIINGSHHKGDVLLPLGLLVLRPPKNV